MADIVASFCNTAECASAENCRPPYCFGMIMPKKRFFLMKSHTFGGRSASSCVICQSSIMPHSSSTGPSMKACSSTLSSGFGCLSNSCQSGLPENNSPSKPTVPASSAVCSVSDSFGVTLANSFSSGALIWRRRKSTSSSGTAISSSTISKITVVHGACSTKPTTSVVATVTIAQVRRLLRWYAQAPVASSAASRVNITDISNTSSRLGSAGLLPVD